MFYGKLFKKYMEKFGEVEFSSNRVSQLSPNELILMAHNLYQYFPKELDNYWDKPEDKLVEIIYSILKKI